MKYQILDQLQQYKAQLLDSVELGSGMQLAMWQNNQDRVSVCSNHHTLSMYIQGGYQSYQKTEHGWYNGGGPDRMCLMPQDFESTWDLRDPLTFVHLYYTEHHLRRIAEQVWDREPSQIALNPQIFVADPQISTLYRHFLLNGAWQNRENHLQMSTATTLLLNHLIKNYSHTQWTTPEVKGGLSPYVLKQLLEWVDQHLHLSLTLSDLAQQTALSEYHFAHMFKQSMKMPPHQYVMQRRLELAHRALELTHENLTNISTQYGFSSSSHFSHRFKKHFGYSPSQMRKK
ncbi:helix-turn-helix domain-containing protein [Acinetobacter venetianus]|uniref:Transposon Tn10 TetD protein n=1 Tax=Acinetobacter venetianus TaxID=52133 RepID=A0A150HJB3_9GAMM|nr:AraC family transcriptional regulator [Acinetobacter venetianus]KXZ62720.1 Transposon Tn10 TetD protein [Acinetobacter venetianus]KXZ66472.1 Transposon Tn10 TetD protein [Acinetobacter venetianus]